MNSMSGNGQDSKLNGKQISYDSNSAIVARVKSVSNIAKRSAGRNIF